VALGKAEASCPIAGKAAVVRKIQARSPESGLSDFMAKRSTDRNGLCI